MSLYSKEIIKHFKNPKNVGKIKNPSGRGEAGNILCGDVMRLYLKISENKKGEKIIKDVKFETLGCIVAIANTSLLTTLVRGKTLKEALSLKKEDLIKKLGQPLPPIKIHCSILAMDALKEAIYDYYLKNKIPIHQDLEKDHQKIIKTKEEIEKRYKNFQAFEKEILK